MIERILTACILFCLIAITGFANAQPVPALQTTTLEGGARVSLESVSYTLERRLLDLSVPGVVGVSPQPDEQEAIVLWIEGIPATSGPSARMSVRPLVIRIYDDRGTECIAAELAAKVASLPGNRHAIVLFNWPRRSSLINLEVCYSLGRREFSTAKFCVKNPKPVKAPAFVPEPAPVKHRDAELEVSLMGLHQMSSNVFWSGPTERIETLERGWKLNTRATFSYRYHGQIATEWTSLEALVTDATGNPYVSAASNLYQPAPDPITYYRPDNNEPVKLALWFYRTANATFAPKETGVLPDLPLKYGRYTSTPGTKVVADGITLELGNIDEIECVGKHTGITVNVYGDDPHLALLLQVKNERGESAKGIGPNADSLWIAGYMRAPDRFRDGPSTDPRRRRCVDFMLDLPPGTARISCTIAVNKGHYFEFTPTPDILPDRTALLQKK